MGSSAKNDLKLRRITFWVAGAIGAVALVALWWLVVDYRRARSQLILDQWNQLQMEVVQQAARSSEAWLEMRITRQNAPKAQAEQEVFRSFIQPIRLLESGDAWIYNRDYIVFDESADLPQEYRGQSMRRIFEMQKARGASHYDEVVRAVENAETGAGWFVWLPEKGREFAAWTSVRLPNETWTIGVSTPETEILASSGLDVQFRREIAWVGAISALLSVSLVLAWRRLRADERTWRQLDEAVEARTAELALSESQLRRRNDELALLNRVSAAAATSLDWQKVLDTAAREVALGLQVPQAGIAVLNEAGDRLTVVAEYMAQAQPSALGMTIPVSENPATEHVIAQREPLVIEDALNDPRMRAVHALMKLRSVASILIVPLIVRDRLLGTLGLDSHTPRAFTPEESRLAMSAVSTAAQAYENARLFDELRRRADELEAIAKVSAALRAVVTRADLLSAAVEQACALFGAQAAFAALRDEGLATLTVQTAHGRWADLVGAQLSLDHSASGLIARTGQPYLNNAVAAEPGVYRADVAGGVQAVAGVPLVAHRHVAGVLWIGRDTAVTAQELRVLGAIGDLAASALQRSALYEDAQRRVQRLSALHTIDLTIAASMDYRLPLQMVLQQGMQQLGADAAMAWVLNSQTRMLHSVMEFGFTRQANGQPRHGDSVRLGSGLTGRAAVERDVVVLEIGPDLALPATGLADGWQERRLVAEGIRFYCGIPMVAKGQVMGVLELLFRRPFRRDEEWNEFAETLAGQAAIAIDNAELFERLQRTNFELVLAYDTTLEGWARALELRDRETNGHTRRVAEMTIRLARAIGMRDDELVHVKRGALLHDIGKMAMPDSILLKRGALSDEEWVTMRQHPIFARELLEPVRFLRPAMDIPYGHHERWDGTGYPRGLRGDEIPLAARVFAVVDVWDALHSERPYHPAWPDAEVREYIRVQSGKHFDPRVVDVFLDLISQSDWQEEPDGQPV
jgi:response regulator RpfG family c-di-GMP phosphodiesterase